MWGRERDLHPGLIVECLPLIPPPHAPALSYLPEPVEILIAPVQPNRNIIEMPNEPYVQLKFF